MPAPVVARRGVLDALRDNPQWRRVYFARSASLLGTWLNTLAIVHLLGRGEVSAALPLAFVFVLKQVPVTLLGPVAGVVADRFDRRRIMIACDALSALAVLGFLFVEPGESAHVVYAMTLLQVCVSVFFDPAYRALVPDLLRDDDLVAANALSAATWSIMFAAGTALGGFVLYAFGWRVAIGLDALSYVVSAALVASVRHPGTRPPVRRERSPSLASLLGVEDVRVGLRYLRDDRDVRQLLLTKTVWGLMGALTLFLTLLGAQPAYRIASSGDLGISALWFCRAVGTGFGPLVARWLGRDDPVRLRVVLVGSFALALACYYAIGLGWSLEVTMALVVVAHVGGSSLWVMSTVLLQQQVPTELRGRTFATEMGLVMLTSSLSYLAYGALIDLGGLSVGQTIRLASLVAAAAAAGWSVQVLRRTRELAAGG